MSERFNATAEEFQLFLAEATEQLGEIERCLIGLEEGGDAAGLITELFRQAHSLKGSAAAIGHHRMAALAHALESALERHRSDGVVLGPAEADIYLVAVDALTALVGEIQEGAAPAAVNVDLLVERLAEAARLDGAEIESVEPEATFEPDSAVEPLGDDALTLSIVFDDQPLAAARAIQVLLLAAELGSGVSSEPTMTQLEEGRLAGPLRLELRTELPTEQIVATLKRVEAVLSIDVVGGAAPAAAADAPAGAEGVGQSASRAVQTVRIDVSRLDSLLGLVGELVIDRTRIAQIASRLEARYAGDRTVEDLVASAARLERISADLQSEVMKSRLLPVDTVFSRFPRLVRDVARRLGKEVHFEVSGRETELDRSVIEDIADPLVHLIRNAIDHGIETTEAREAAGKPRVGTLRLSARHEESYIVVEVEDDGKGIDPAAVAAAAIRRGVTTEEAVARMSPHEIIDLVFAPGFSLAAGVTDLSGRGVGMDVVRANVQRLKGSVAIQTEKGRGTKVTVKLPLTLAILRALLVSVAGRPFAIPLASVVETLRISRSELTRVTGADVYRLRGDVLPVVWLDQALQIVGESKGAAADRTYVVAAQQGARRVGLAVEALLGEQEIVVKPMGALAGDAPGIAGATILGDGRVAPILDVSALMDETSFNRERDAALVGAR